MFGHGFSPYKGVSIGCRFDFCAVDEHFGRRDLLQLDQKLCHLCHKVTGAFGKVLRTKTCDCGMIRGLSAFEKIHVVDIALAVFLDCS